MDWYWNRLRCMSLAEIMHRARAMIYYQIHRHGFLLATKVPPADISCPSNSWVADIPDCNPGLYCRAADDILRGQWQIFALTNPERDRPLQWNRDPKTGKVAPMIMGKLLDYRDEQVVGDIKYTWEPNRHLQLVTIAQAYSLSGDSSYLKGLSEHLNSWFEQCPYPLGPNWANSLELAIRLINWALVWYLIGGVDSPLFEGRDGFLLRQRWLASIYQQCHFIQGNFSLYSSANNHLIGETAGLFIASITWPYWPKMKRWRQKAYQILVEECLKQNALDGSNSEQTTAYQQFILDFLLLSALAGQKNGNSFPDEYWTRIEKMIEYIASIMDWKGHVPMIGDADDGYVVRFSQEADFCPYRSLLATGAVLFKRPDFGVKAGKLDDKTRWLLGDRAERTFATLSLRESTATLPVRREFPDGGYYILGMNFESKDEIRLIVDCGPLGYLSIAAHGHADALSLALSVGGKEILIDPGTYAYHTNQKWRNYFRGTSAHNTVRVDLQDQSLIGGNFMWLEKARARCERWETSGETDFWTGSHDGYSRLTDPVIHKREIRLIKQARRIRVVDYIICKKEHVVERFWHFSEACRVDSDGKNLSVHNGSITVQFSSCDEVSPEEHILCGQDDPPGGWISRHYDVKVPTTTVVWSNTVRGETQITTEIQC